VHYSTSLAKETTFFLLYQCFHKTIALTDSSMF